MSNKVLISLLVSHLVHFAKHFDVLGSCGLQVQTNCILNETVSTGKKRHII